MEDTAYTHLRKTRKNPLRGIRLTRLINDSQKRFFFFFLQSIFC